MNPLEQRLLASPSLPTLPRVAQRVLELARRDDVDLGELARAIGTDPALSAKLLRLINSPLYRMTHEVTSLRDAALYLGLNAVKNVALSFSLIHKLRGPDGSGPLDAVWRASLMNALAARKLASAVGGWDPEEAFLMGLIADTGVLVLLKGVDSYAALVSRFLEGERDLIDLERAELGTDHARLTMLLLKQWEFPQRMRVLVAVHHAPDAAPLDPTERERARILSVAWLCARALTVRGFSVESASLDARVAALLGLTKQRSLELIAELPGELCEAASLFDIPVEEQLDWGDLLEEANARLSDSALSAERESAELGAAASAELAQRSRDLSPPLEYDGPTRILCESSFETLLDAYQRRARRGSTPLSVLAIEVTDLKDLAAELGAKATVDLLREVGSRALAVLRPSDAVGRVGSDRIGAMLPVCALSAALVAAQRVRTALEREPIRAGAREVTVSVAIGVAGLANEKSAERNLLAAALAALDAARESAERIAS